jgi:hypothetical protein
MTVAVTSDGESLTKGDEKTVKKRTKSVIFKQVRDQKKSYSIIVTRHPIPESFNAKEELWGEF